MNPFRLTQDIDHLSMGSFHTADYRQCIADASLLSFLFVEKLLLADLDVGHRNLKNIEALKEINGLKQKLFVLRGEGKDYTGGTAEAIVDGLIETGRGLAVTREELETI